MTSTFIGAEEGYKIVLFGSYGTGKTTLAATMPGYSLLVDMHEEADKSWDKHPTVRPQRISGSPTQQLNTLLMLQKQLMAQANKETRFHNIIIDSSSAVRRQAEKFVGGVPQTLEEMVGLSFPQQKRVSSILDNVLLPFFDLTQLSNPYNVIITGQEVTKTETTKENMATPVVTGYQLDLPPRVRGFLSRRADAVWRLELETVFGSDGKPSTVPDRHLVYTRPSTFYGTKTRTHREDLPHHFGTLVRVDMPYLIRETAVTTASEE